MSQMSGQSYFTIKIQYSIFKNQSKSNHTPAIFEMLSPSPNEVQKIKKQQLFKKKYRNDFTINTVLYADDINLHISEKITKF